MVPDTPNDALGRKDALPAEAVLKAREVGPGKVTPPPVGEMPAGDAKWPVPHYLSKISIINQIARAYRWTFDEALKDSRNNAVAMLRDLVIRDALETRIVPTVQLAWHLEPQDETDPEQVRATALLERIIRLTPRLQDLHKAAMWAVWYGRAGVSLLYEWDFLPTGERIMKIRDHRPINGDSLIAHWSGDWGQYVNSLYEGPKTQGERGFEVFYNAAQREAVIIHTHNPEDADFYEPELSGQIKGSGVRGHCYWFWWLKSNFLALLGDYAERFASGIKIAYYDKTNPDGKTEVENAIAGYRDSGYFVFPSDSDGHTPYRIEVKEVGTASPQFIMEMVTGYFDQYIHRYITGASIEEDTSISAGGDAVGVLEDRVARVVKSDATRLGETYNIDLLPTLCRYNCGEHVPPPRWVFDVEKPNAGEILGYSQAIRNMGGDIDMTHLYEVCGLPQPQPGDNISSKLQPMSPTAVAQVPQGTPTVSAATQPQGQQTVQQVSTPQPTQSAAVPVQQVPPAQ